MASIKTARVCALNSHAAHARFLRECLDERLGYIPRQRDIPSPYAYAPSHLVYEWNLQPVIVVETRHWRYEVFRITAGDIWDNDDCAGDPVLEVA